MFSRLPRGVKCYIAAFVITGAAVVAVFARPSHLADARVFLLAVALAVSIRRSVTIPAAGVAWSLSGAVVAGALAALGLGPALWTVLLAHVVAHRYYPHSYQWVFTLGNISTALWLLDLVAPVVPSELRTAFIAVGYMTINFGVYVIIARLRGVPLWRTTVSEFGASQVFALNALLAVVVAHSVEAGIWGAVTASSLVALISVVLDRLARNMAILHLLPVGVALWNEDERCVLVNELFCRMTDVPAGEWLSSNYSDFVEMVKRGSDEQPDMKPPAAVRTRLPRTGGGLPVEVRVDAWNRGSAQAGTAVVVRDVTSELAAERNARLATAGKLAAGAAHEIKNPLTAINGFLQLVEPKLPESERTWLSVAMSELNRVNAIVEDLLVFARSTPEPSQPVDLREAVRRVMELTRHRARQQEVSMDIEAPADGEFTIWANERSLIQVLLNLTNNALDAMPHGGALSITLSNGEGTVKCTVADTGPGLPREVADRLFEPFVTTKKNGSGLGLAISNQIIERLGGSIEVSSTPGTGATFILQFPVRPPS